MVAFSSFKPFVLSQEVAALQIAAKQSWNKAFTWITYFNEPEPLLESSNTTFVVWEPFPRIVDMVKLAAAQREWACLINADIVVGKQFSLIAARLANRKALAATSWRYEFEPKVGIQTGMRVDCGLDFFAATPGTWKRLIPHVPAELRMGCQRWDSWMLGALNSIAARGFYSITKARVIFHPRHTDRKYGYDIPSVPVFGSCHWPPEF